MQTLRPFQLDLVDRVRAARGRGARIVVVQAQTGAGKTTIAAYIAGQAVAKNKRCLFIVHRRKLVDQISERLHDFGIIHGVIMAGEHGYGAASVQVASRDTIVSRCFSHEWTGLPQADVVFIDEGHHACDPASDYRRIIDQYPNATILPMTATPADQDGRGLGPWAQAIECAAPTTQLIRDGFLVPVTCYAPDRKMHRGKAKRGIAGDLVESWKEFAEGKPTVLFTSRIQHSLDAVAAFKAAGISFAHVDADTPDDERDRIFGTSKKKGALELGLIQGVSNVGICKEGTDIPCLGCCQIYMEMSGRVAFLQAVGRIMRPYAGKTHAVLIDHAGVVFNHGFPDEDTEWTLEGNVNEAFKKKHDAGNTNKVLYCKRCSLMYHGTNCPRCGSAPTKPPRSLFAPPPVDASSEILTLAERNQREASDKRDREKHWITCLGVAVGRGGTFGMAAQIYKRKYGSFPDNSFPSMPKRYEWQMKVKDKFPNFGRRKPAVLETNTPTFME